MTPAFGKVVTEVYYKNGNESGGIRKTEEIIKVDSRNELWGVILDQLDKPDNEVEFRIIKDKYTHEPIRIEITHEVRL